MKCLDYVRLHSHGAILYFHSQSPSGPLKVDLKIKKYWNEKRERKKETEKLTVEKEKLSYSYSVTEKVMRKKE